MYRTIFSAELTASRNYSYVLLAANVVLVIVALYFDSNLFTTVASLSTLFFWVIVVAYSISYGDEKRCRLYTQLPTNHFEVFISTWAVIILWLFVSVLFWLAYAMLTLPETGIEVLAELLTGAVGIILFTLLIAIAIDLGEVQPRVIQWLYIVSLISFAIIANELEWSSHIGLRVDNDSFSVFPFAFDDYGTAGILYAIATLALFFYANFKVYEKSENFIH